jgi:hypothetical protein
MNDEYYMVHDALWKLAGMEPDGGMLCIGCLETRLGRKLVRGDFTDYPINSGQLFPQSSRLRERLAA